MTTRLTEFEEGEIYGNRLGEYIVEELIDKNYMRVHCYYNGEPRIFNIRIAQMTIFNLNRGR